MPTGSKPAQALRIARALGCDAAQIFVSNPRAWQIPEPNPAAEEAFRQMAIEQAITPVVVHATYLINLASPRDDLFEKSITLLAATLERAARFGAASVVFHIGSSSGAPEAEGLARLVLGIERTLAAAPIAAQAGVRLLLENDVGGGSKLGHRFENLATTLDLLPQHATRLGVCLDTAHLWGAGCDISTPAGAAAVLAEANRTLGLARVEVLHLNDSPKGMGSHLDQHARLGEGLIGLDGIRALLRAPGLAHTTVLLETPIAEYDDGQPDWIADRGQILRARSLAGLPLPRRTAALVEIGEIAERAAQRAT